MRNILKSRRKTGKYGNATHHYTSSSGVATKVEIKVNQINGIEFIEWSTWYAWFPVKTQHQGWKWFEKVYRRKSQLVSEESAKGVVSFNHYLSKFIYDTSELVLLDKLSGDKYNQIPKLLSNQTLNRVKRKVIGNHTLRNIQLIV